MKTIPRDNSKSVGKVAESIKAFGFLQPIVCDSDGVILAGHTRYRAAQMLGLKEVPVVYASDLTPSQARAYRLADNKVSEGSLWLDDLLSSELDILQTEDPAFDATDFGFESIAAEKRRKQWKHIEKYCNLEQNVRTVPKCGIRVITLFETGPDGKSLNEIKKDPGMVVPFAQVTADHLCSLTGGSFLNGCWCICTTPKRRHASGFHFATEICKKLSDELGIPFYEDAVVAHSRRRINTDFSLEKDPSEHNIILFDDIVTTGVTMKDTRALLLASGHLVLSIAAIKN